MVPTARGPRLSCSTVTPTSCSALRPSGSVAVMVTTAEPAATPSMSILLPDTLTVATLVLELVAP